MPLYQVLATISVPCMTAVRADTAEQAGAIALQRSLDTRPAGEDGLMVQNAFSHWITRRADQPVKGTPLSDVKIEDLDKHD